MCGKKLLNCVALLLDDSGDLVSLTGEGEKALRQLQLAWEQVQLYKLSPNLVRQLHSLATSITSYLAS